MCIRDRVDTTVPGVLRLKSYSSYNLISDFKCFKIAINLSGSIMQMGVLVVETLNFPTHLKEKKIVLCHFNVGLNVVYN